MTQPTPPPPAVIGTNPRNADEVNGGIGTHLRGFIASKNTVHGDQLWLAGVDLTVEPYNFTSEQETTIKSAVSGLDTALQAVDMTFINQVVGIV